MTKLAVIILTYNEEKHIGRALQTVSTVAHEIFVVDSFSTDRTVEIANLHGAKVFRNAFINQARQLQWAIDNLPITAEWIMRLDADEIIEADLRAEIADRLPSIPEDIVGINLTRKHVFLGRWIRYGGRYPVTLLRIWRRGKGKVEDRWMDEHMIVWGGRTVTFSGGFADHNLGDLSYFTDKHNKYATREAVEILNQKMNLFPRAQSAEIATNSWQASIKRIAKEKIYYRIPFQISALSYFLLRYFFQLGFLDGKEGLIYHALQGFWYRFLVGAKVVELERALGSLGQPSEIRSELARLTGLRL